MFRASIIGFFCVLTLASWSQGQEKYVRVYGQVLSQEDSTPVAASFFYEKLPYYDDMGMAKSNTEGNFEFYLLDNTSYSFKITKSGFLEFTNELAVVDSGDGSMKNDFYIEPEKEPELIKLQNLIFSRGSADISESSYDELNQLVKFLDERPNIVIQLEGHTDFAGNADANMRLSQARVESVKEYLLDQGIKKDRVLTKAFGGTQPLSTERTDEAKTMNRRVEVRIIRR